MTDRELLEALVFASENLLRQINQADPKTSMDIQIRLASITSRAKESLFPVSR